MIYTIGHTESYNRYFREQDKPMKKGCSEGYAGGSVWRSQNEALRNCPDGYSVFAVAADWDKDTIPSKDGDWHDLLVDALLIKLNYRDDYVDVGVREQEEQGVRGRASSGVNGLPCPVERPVGAGVPEGVV